MNFILFAWLPFRLSSRVLSSGAETRSELQSCCDCSARRDVQQRLQGAGCSVKPVQFLVAHSRTWFIFGAELWFKRRTEGFFVLAPTEEWQRGTKAVDGSCEKSLLFFVHLSINLTTTSANLRHGWGLEPIPGGCGHAEILNADIIVGSGGWVGSTVTSYFHGCDFCSPCIQCLPVSSMLACFCWVLLPQLISEHVCCHLAFFWDSAYRRLVDTVDVI